MARPFGVRAVMEQPLEHLGTRSRAATDSPRASDAAVLNSKGDRALRAFTGGAKKGPGEAKVEGGLVGVEARGTIFPDGLDRFGIPSGWSLGGRSRGPSSSAARASLS